jgi:putative transcriptional regulator
MNEDIFGRLVESMTQMNEIINGERAPSREHVIDSVARTEVRECATGQNHV